MPPILKGKDEEEIRRYLTTPLKSQNRLSIPSTTYRENGGDHDNVKRAVISGDRQAGQQLAIIHDR